MRRHYTKREKILLWPPPMPRWTLHNLRRTARTGFSALPQRFDPEMCERVIGHVPAGVRRTYDMYQYRDEKREMLNAWARRLKQIIWGSPFTDEDMHDAQRADFFGLKLSEAGMRTLIKYEDGGEDSTGRRRGIVFARDGSPIGVQTIWREISPDTIRGILCNNTWSPLAPDADLNRYGRVPLNAWHRRRASSCLTAWP